MRLYINLLTKNAFISFNPAEFAMAEELENDEIIYVKLADDLESDCGITISVTCPYFF